MFSVREEMDGFRIISTDRHGEVWDIDGPFDTQAEADTRRDFHQPQWTQSHPDEQIAKA